MEFRIEFYYFLIIFIYIIFHLIIGYSMIDIFYKFPLNYGMTPHSSNLTEKEIPSNRVVLIILDGVRADTFFESVSSGKSPFLRNIVTKRGVYGISHSKVPTESGPCFTAICSGHLEYASLILKDLSDEEVIFDSIFNQTKYSFGIGKDSCKFGKIAKQLECFNKEGYNGYPQDCILIDELIAKMSETKYNKNNELYKRLTSNKIAFIIHIEDTDGKGHFWGPKTESMFNYLIRLDSYYEKLEKFFKDFYNDDKTTFIITSDHGMDMQRGHGDGKPDCTRTPFVIWGSGIRKAIYRDKKPDNEDTPSNWTLDNYVRNDINQIDIAPLIAGLLGINYPINSLGIIPLNILNVNDKIKSKLLYGNMMELLELYKIKDDIESKAIIYKAFGPLINYNKLKKNILDNVVKGYYSSAINETNNFIDLTLQGIDYLFHYDRAYLKTIVFLGYISWMIYLIIFIQMKNENVLNKFFYYNKEQTIINTIFMVILICLFIYLILRISPFMYFIYTLFPCYFLWRIVANINYLKAFFFFPDDIKKTLIHFVYYILTILAFLSVVSNIKFILI